MAKVVVDTVKSIHEKINSATLKGGQVVKWWKDSAFNDKLKDGAEVEMKTEEKPSRLNPSDMERWVTEVDGVGAKSRPGGGGGGGGGRPPAAPRDEAIIVAQVCLKGAIDVGIHNALTDTKARQIDPNEVKALYNEFCDLFTEGYRRLKGEIARA